LFGVTLPKFFDEGNSTRIQERVAGYSSWIEVDLDAIGFNLEQVRKMTGSEVVPCIKKNAYAHGIVHVVAYLMEKDVKRFLVAKLWEAQQIRRAGLTCGVINQDPLFTSDQFSEVVEKDITQVIYHRKSAEKLSEAATSKGKTASIWVKVDTGLGRAGVVYREAVELIEYVASLPGLQIDALYTTLLEDENDPLQIQRLKDVKKSLREKEIEVPTLSIASSHGIFFDPNSHLDAVRPGVMLFGWYPVPEAREEGVELRQALSLKGRLEHMKWVDPGTPLTYGGAYVAEKRMKVGTMHMGYSDGYLRQLSKKGIVKVEGKICPIIGGVSINHFLIDLSGTDAEAGNIVDAVSFTGENDAHGLCDIAGVEPYQLAVWMNPLTPRVYYRSGVPVALSELELTNR
jgi:alanine racemase